MDDILIELEDYDSHMAFVVNVNEISTIEKVGDDYEITLITLKSGRQQKVDESIKTIMARYDHKIRERYDV